MTAGEVPGEAMGEGREAAPPDWATEMASEFQADVIGDLSEQTATMEDAIHSEHQRTVLGSRSGMLGRQRGLVHDGRQLGRGVDQLRSDQAGEEAAFAASMAHQIASGGITVPEGGPLTPEEIAYVEAHPIPGHGMADAVRALRAERAAAAGTAPIPPPVDPQTGAPVAPPPAPALAPEVPTDPSVTATGEIEDRPGHVPYS